MPEAARWCLIFADGTGQRGVRDDASAGEPDISHRNTNVFQMYVACADKPGFETFYDPGLGTSEEGSFPLTRKARDLWAKATGWGITANIADCYEALMLKWRPGMKIGLFGFSRGAYTVRCLGGVLATCGIAPAGTATGISDAADGPGAKKRRTIAEEAVAAYKIKDADRRKAAGRDFARAYGAAEKVADAVGVFDTVKSLGLPGVLNVVNPFQHEFHNRELSVRVPVGLQALSIDENRKQFLPEIWDDVDAEGQARGQVIEQHWFPGVHSDVGGGYEDNRLADLPLAWMLARLKALAGLDVPLAVQTEGKLLAPQHDERTGMGVLWLAAERTVRGRTNDVDALCEAIETRFDGHSPRYRPKPLGRHPRVKRYYA